MPDEGVRQVSDPAGAGVAGGGDEEDPVGVPVRLGFADLGFAELERRLGHEQAARRPADVAFLGDGNEVPQRAQVHPQHDTRKVSGVRRWSWTPRSATANDGKR